MLKITVLSRPGRSVVLMDSITKLTVEDEGQAVVSASHGGVSSGEFALQRPGAVVFFNDAGRGKEEAGIAALAMLDAKHIPAGAISHTSARIGDAQDHWDSGIISAVNESARVLGFAPDQPVSMALTEWAETGCVRG